MEILFVEDSYPILTPLMENMERWGHRVEISGTGKDALRKVRQKRFDLVLLDIFLPDCKGHELIPQFKEVWPDIGIITMTGYNSRELEWEARQQGILYYMIKPFDMSELKLLLDHISNKKGGEKPWQNLRKKWIRQ